MASTATNKQPLLIDRVLHSVIDLINSTVIPNSGVEVGGTNTAALLVDCTTNDGALIEDIYTYSRGTDYTVNLYVSSAADYLRPQQGIFIGTFQCGVDSGKREEFKDMPKILAPVPQVGTEAQYRALYVPKGLAIWAAVVQLTANDTAQNAPIIGAQGGFY
nr:hypothetical protein 13 [bacterium]BDD46710.1 hypothetical protein 21 [Paracoccaceae bacterium]